jgi:hypothetical protein
MKTTCSRKFTVKDLRALLAKYNPNLPVVLGTRDENNRPVINALEPDVTVELVNDVLKVVITC